MMILRKTSLLVLAILVCLVPAAFGAETAPSKTTLFVDAPWVKENASKLILIDARASTLYAKGHIPGAVNRPYTADLAEDGQFRPIDQLAAEYARLIPAKQAPVIVHCRTGQQASQAWFLLTRLLGYENVRWYDGSWTDWAARPDKPVATGKISPG